VRSLLECAQDRAGVLESEQIRNHAGEREWRHREADPFGCVLAT